MYAMKVEGTIFCLFLFVCLFGLVCLLYDISNPRPTRIWAVLFIYSFDYNIISLLILGAFLVSYALTYICFELLGKVCGKTLTIQTRLLLAFIRG